MQYLMIFAILFPVVAALGIYCKKISGNLSTLHKYVFGAALINSIALLTLVFGGSVKELNLIYITDNLRMVLACDGLSRVFIMIISILWPLTTLYAFDYMKHEGGELRGKNTVHCFRAEGLSVVHLGDLGHLLSPEQIHAIGPCDVLLIPIGGVFTIDSAEAKTIVDALSPSVVVPMHYRLGKIDFPELSTVDEFISKLSREDDTAANMSY